MVQSTAHSSSFQTCTATLNIFRHYPGKLHVTKLMSESDSPERQTPAASYMWESTTLHNLQTRFSQIVQSLYVITASDFYTPTTTDPWTHWFQLQLQWLMLSSQKNKILQNVTIVFPERHNPFPDWILKFLSISMTWPWTGKLVVDWKMDQWESFKSATHQLLACE